jgi:hypothetical protein
MHVAVDEAGDDELAAEIDDRRAARARPDLGRSRTPA